MELALTVFNVGAGLGILAVGVAMAYAAWRLTPLIRETRALTAELRELSALARTRLPVLADRADDILGGVDVLAGDAAVKLARLGDVVETLESAAPPRDALPASAHPSDPTSVESAQTPDGWSDR